MQGTRIWSLVEELRSHMPQSAAKKKIILIKRVRCVDVYVCTPEYDVLYMWASGFMLCVWVDWGFLNTLISNGPVNVFSLQRPQGAPLTLVSPLRQAYSAAASQFHISRNCDLFPVPTGAYYPWWSRGLVKLFFYSSITRWPWHASDYDQS